MIMNTISVVTIAKNEGRNIAAFLQTVLGWVDEIIIIDNNSTDQTAHIANQYKAKVFKNKSTHLGKLKNYALSKATKDWILLLDVDEHVSIQLHKEIQIVLRGKTEFDGFLIPYQNHFLGHSLKVLEHYKKVRLFRKEKGYSTDVAVHEEVVVSGKVGELRGALFHYSYRSIPHIIKKFTHYAHIEARLFYNQGKKTEIKNLTLYPLHMFWSIFIKDKGYKDGIWGLGLALCFSYYEFMRYFFLFFLAQKTDR